MPKKHKPKGRGRGGRGRGAGGRGHSAQEQLPRPGRSEAGAAGENESLDDEEPEEASCRVPETTSDLDQPRSSAEEKPAFDHSHASKEQTPIKNEKPQEKHQSFSEQETEPEKPRSSHPAEQKTKGGEGKQQPGAPTLGKSPTSHPAGNKEKTPSPPSQAAAAAAAAAVSVNSGGVQKPTTKLGSSLTTEEHTARQGDGLHPPKRPDYGTVGRSIKLRANFFPLKISSKLTDLYHYDVEITPNKCPKAVKRDVVREIVRKYKDSTFKGHAPAFDGEKNLYSRIKLPVGNGEGAVSEAELSVKLCGEDGGKDRDFKVKIQFAGQVNLGDLKDYLDGKGNGKVPQDAIQALDIIMRQMPSLHFMPVGRSFFPLNDGFSCPLGEGCEVRFGFYSSVRHSEWKVPLLNIDVSAKGFTKTQPVIELVDEILRPRPGELENPRSRKFNWDKFVQVIKGLRVETTHLSYKRRYTVWGVTKYSADNLQFEVDDSGQKIKSTVAEYFKEKYKIQLRYGHLPCLLAGPKKDRYLPLEVCKVIPCQRKHLTDEQTANMIKHTARPAPKREEDIVNWENKYVETSGEYLENEFGISVTPEQVKLDGRVLPAPQLNLGSQDKALVPRDGSWDLRDKHLFSGAELIVWTVACLALPPNKRSDNILWRFCEALFKMSCREGMKMEEPADLAYLRDACEMEGTFKDWLRSYPQLQLILVVVPPKNNKEMYAEMKRVGDNLLGIPTQCVKLKQVEEAKPQVCANLSLKINAKLGGVNHVIDPKVKSLVFKEPVIIFGADVTHPSPGENGIPSIAAVVASMDPHAAKYYARVRAQKHEKSGGAQEIINDLAVMVKELLLDFYRTTKSKPVRIIFYRDGVSEGQFGQVLVHEVRAVQKACTMLEEEYRPRITFIVVQKRHHTRFFCEDKRDACGTGKNVPPGTVVDRGITHPYEFDFYLNSHFGIKGTSRPTHYHVLYDDNNFKADNLQQLTYQLCHVYARCTRSVSMPAPAFYAHLVAFRARYHVTNKRGEEAVDLEQSARDIEVNDKMKRAMYFT